MQFTAAYLESQGWGWMLALPADDRDKCFYELERDLLDEKERLETENSYEDDGPRWRRNCRRLRELAELLEPAEVVTELGGRNEQLKALGSRRSSPSSVTSFAGQARAGGHGETDAPSMCDPPNSSTAEETGSLSPESEAVLENHHADTFRGMAA